VESTRYRIRQENPDIVLLAIGATAAPPPIPGIDTALSAVTAYASPESIGQKVLIVGGGLVGCEVGLWLAALGREVFVADMLNAIASEAIRMYRAALFREMERNDV
jgi:pyruvate/2-oxoglutarate dehydrogenase complex dihydrolipoamide dehydrogenase (E3) component